MLVVDDEPDARQIINQLLRFHAIACDTVADAEVAVQMLASGHYDAVVIDLALPVMHGWELVRQIRSNPETAALRCIAITAYHTSMIRHEAFEMGFSAYFPKPLDEYNFVHELLRLMAIE